MRCRNPASPARTRLRPCRPIMTPARVGRSLSAYRQMMTTPLQQAQIGKERAETTKAEAETMALGPKTDAEIAKDRAEAAKATAESGKPTDRGELNVTGPDGKVKAVLAQQLPGGQWVTDDERRVPMIRKPSSGRPRRHWRTSRNIRRMRSRCSPSKPCPAIQPRCEACGAAPVSRCRS